MNYFVPIGHVNSIIGVNLDHFEFTDWNFGLEKSKPKALLKTFNINFESSTAKKTIKYYDEACFNADLRRLIDLLSNR